jgi:hypothetical protein
MSPAFEELENDIWPEPDVYADVEAVLAVLVGGSLDRGDDPVVAVAENTTPEQGEVNDAVAGSGRVDHRCGQRRFVGGVENQFGEIGPLVHGLPAVRDGQSCRQKTFINAASAVLGRRTPLSGQAFHGLYLRKGIFPAPGGS